MAYASEPRSGRFQRRNLKVDFASEDDNWREDPEPARDLKKYILVFGLGALSWVATYIGMLELIQANLGSLPFTHKVVIGFSVAMLMVMIVWLLDQLFKPHVLSIKLAYVGGYLFLTLISVGFGFGFYWKVLESRSEASRSAESAVGQVQTSLNGATIRLEQLQATLAQLADVSEQKSEIERTKGTSCPNSRPGDGPRRKMRADDAAKFLFASQFVAGRVGAIKGDIGTLDGDLAKIAKKDESIVDKTSGTRNEFMRALGRKLDMTVAGFNAFRTDPQLKQLRSDLATRADQTLFKTADGKSFSCPDSQLQQALRGAVRAMDQLPVLDKPEIAVVEGSEATIEAFRRLTATLEGVLTFKLPPSADELRELQQKAIRQAVSPAEQAKVQDQVAGLSSRDYVPLGIALFVDLCLLLVSMGKGSNRIENLVPKMRAAERGPVIEILSRFKDIHRDPDVRANFEIFRHVVFDQNGDYYVAVPLDAPYRGVPRGYRGESYGTEQAQELQHEAHLLANLFTSFEKERIFRRVYNPLLLNTKAIQKRLARQGSKFADCEAFRVYKFRDGAWSEIILGAVMGAARRAETKRRRAALEDQLFAAQHAEPGLSFADAMQSRGRTKLNDALASVQKEYATTATAAFDLRELAGGHAANNNTERPSSGPETSPMDDVFQAADSPAQHRSARAMPTSAEVTEDHLAKYGPYAFHVPAEEDDAVDSPFDAAAETEQEATVEFEPPVDTQSDQVSVAAQSQPEATTDQLGISEGAARTAQSSKSSGVLSRTEEKAGAAAITTSGRTEAALDQRLDDVRHSPVTVNSQLTADGHLDVILTRDTATFSVPVTEATLPHGLNRLMRTALASIGEQAAQSSLSESDKVQLVEAVEDNELLDDSNGSDQPPIALSYQPIDADDNDDDDDDEFPTEDLIEPVDDDEFSQIASRFAASAK